jgi:hypothetical protein
MRRLRIRPGVAGILMAGVIASDAVAGVLSRLEVEHERGRYRIAADLIVDASPSDVRALLTDYTALPALNRSIRRSQVLTSPTPDRVRVSTTVRACVLAVCQTLIRVEDILERDEFLIADIVPEQSNFRFGRTEWRFKPLGDQSLVEYRSEMEPDFSVPPVVGPVLIRRELERELKAVLETLKRRVESRETG